MSQPTGVFITLEGSEGTGKSTALKFIQDYLIQAKKEYIITREPGGTPIAEQIRQVLLTPDAGEAMMPETELLLMFACRVQHIQHVILPALKDGKWVICDRFIDASFAYQGGGRGVDETRIAWLENWLVSTLRPDLTLLLDAPVSVGLERAKHRGAQDRIEQEKIDFFERVRAGYLNRMKQDKNRFRLIDATQSLDQVQVAIKKILDEI
jgi:dTMP kinase